MMLDMEDLEKLDFPTLILVERDALIAFILEIMREENGWTKAEMSAKLLAKDDHIAEASGRYLCSFIAMWQLKMLPEIRTYWDTSLRTIMNRDTWKLEEVGLIRAVEGTQ